jgi:hypothetical protein
MSNVKEGDLARLVFDAGGLGNEGAQMLVLEPLSCKVGLLAAALVEAGMGKMWMCQILQPMKLQELAGRSSPRILPPGTIATFPDRDLRRIDPPADTEAIFRDRPINDQEFTDQLNRKIKELL